MFLVQSALFGWFGKAPWHFLVYQITSRWIQDESGDNLSFCQHQKVSSVIWFSAPVLLKYYSSHSFLLCRKQGVAKLTWDIGIKSLHL